MQVIASRSVSSLRESAGEWSNDPIKESVNINDESDIQLIVGTVKAESDDPDASVHRIRTDCTLLSMFTAIRNTMVDKSIIRFILRSGFWYHYKTPVTFLCLVSGNQA